MEITVNYCNVLTLLLSCGSNDYESEMERLTCRRNFIFHCGSAQMSSHENYSDKAK